MSTFGQLKQAGYDRLGLGSNTPDSNTVVLIERFVNDACNEIHLRNLEAYFANANNQAWWWLEATTSFVFTNTQSYTLSGPTVNSATDVGHAIRLFDPFGVPLEIVAGDTFEDLYAGDTTAANPTVATISGSVQTTTAFKAAQTIKIWGKPTTTTTGSLNYLRAWTDIVTGSDSTIPFIPVRLHPEITDLVLARVDRYQDSEMAPQAEQRAVGGLGASINQ